MGAALQPHYTPIYTAHMKNPWSNYAGIWSGHTEPLEPTAPDIESYRAALESSDPQQRRLCAILGVTRKLHHLCSTLFGRVTGNDFNPEMIAKVWPGASADAHRCNWKQMPYADGELDAAVCDGGWHLQDADTKRAVAQELYRTLHAQGRFVVRLFLPIDPAPTMSDIKVAFDNGQVQSVNYLKVLLWFATAAEHGHLTAPLKEVWANFFRWSPGQDPYSLLLDRGFNPASIATLDIYKDNEARYMFETLSDTKATFVAAGFRLRSESRPPYYLGEYFPVLCFEK